MRTSKRLSVALCVTCACTALLIAGYFILPHVRVGGLTDLNQYASTLSAVSNGSVAHFPPGSTVFPAGTRFEATGMQANRIDLYVPGTPADAQALATQHTLARDTDHLVWMTGINRQFSLQLNPASPAARWGTFQGNAGGGAISFLWVNTATGERVYVASVE